MAHRAKGKAGVPRNLESEGQEKLKAESSEHQDYGSRSWNIARSNLFNELNHPNHQNEPNHFKLSISIRKLAVIIPAGINPMSSPALFHEMPR